jgi:hypothetical protein
VTELVNAADLTQYAALMSVCEESHQSPWLAIEYGKPKPAEHKSAPRLRQHGCGSDRKPEHNPEGKP